MLLLLGPTVDPYQDTRSGEAIEVVEKRRRRSVLDQLVRKLLCKSGR